VLTPAGRRIAELFEDAPSLVAFLRGPTHVYEWVNRTGLRVTAGREIIGKSVGETLPESGEQGLLKLLDEVYNSGEARRVSEQKWFILDELGEKRWGYYDFVCQPITDDGGSVLGLLFEGHEVTERVTARQALEAREQHLSLAIEAGRMAVCALDPETNLVEGSPELKALLGLSDADFTVSKLKALLAPGECDRVAGQIAAAVARGESFFEAEVRWRPSETDAARWLLVRGRTSSSTTQAGPRLFMVMMDLTERKADEERLHLLAREIDHRANNLLATVQSLVSLTRAGDAASFREALLGRIAALAQAHRLLAESRWTGASLCRLVGEEMCAFAPKERSVFAGPDARLAPPVAQGLAVALHELCTNALKYGAWSAAGGRVIVSWTAPSAASLIEMTWKEIGGPIVNKPERSGFGMALLKRALGGAIGGDVELRWPPEGLWGTLRFPVQ
jgi:PAS domain S-box-containing protein